MAKYKVLCQWSVTGDHYVEAQSAEEAIVKVQADLVGHPLPSETSYVDGTFRVLEDLVEKVDDEEENDD